MKKTLSTIAVTLTITALLAPAAAAQSRKGKGTKAPAGPTPIEVTLDQISDRRSTGFFAQLHMSLALEGTTLGEVDAARVVVKTAVDDTGVDLLDPEAGEPQWASASHGYYSEDMAGNPVKVDVVLKNPSRDAVAVKEVSGEIELYMPKKDPAATASIPKFQSAPGKPLASKELKASGVEIVVLGLPQLEAEREKGAKAKAEELKKEGYDAEAIQYSVDSFKEYYPMPGEGEVAMRIKDPNGVIQQLVFVDSSGEEVRAFINEEEGLSIASSYGGDPIAEDWGLKVTLRTPKTLARHTFRIADVELP